MKKIGSKPIGHANSQKGPLKVAARLTSDGNSTHVTHSTNGHVHGTVKGLQAIGERHIVRVTVDGISRE
jgi:hypothetical protein